MVFVLVHSPLVGPSTWLPVARELERRGRRAVVPSLLGPAAGAPQGHWRQCVEAVRDAVRRLSEPIVLLGHSGGGLLLPAIADAVAPPVSGLIFVDSRVPARTGETPLARPSFLDHLRTLAVDGLLPPWSTWWSEDSMRELVPDEALRSALTREMPSLPLAYLEQRIPSPDGWDRMPCAYLLLSDAYREASADASERGWRVEEIPSAASPHRCGPRSSDRRAHPAGWDLTRSRVARVHCGALAQATKLSPFDREGDERKATAVAWSMPWFRSAAYRLVTPHTAA
jgi:pimeloyl-ACP methyl ester carboxylesterase